MPQFRTLSLNSGDGGLGQYFYNFSEFIKEIANLI